MRLKIAARRSDLARLQAYRVGDALKSAHAKLEIEYCFKESLGDKNLEDPLWKMPEKGVFTEDFRDDLLEGRVDLVVHSWKDLPVEPRAGSEIAATLTRADPRDLLLLKRSSAAARPRALRILSSSPRRAYTLPPFLRECLPFPVEEAEFLPVRGNIPTRLLKYLESGADGIVVAKAALDRLLSAKEVEFSSAQETIRNVVQASLWTALPLELHPTAAAQGALAIEVSRSRSDILELLKAIHCEASFQAVERERKILASHGGGCHQKIGVTVLPVGEHGEVTYLRGETELGERLEKTEFRSLTVAPRYPLAKKWPENPEGKFFSRRILPNLAPPRGGLFAARAEALPEYWQISSDTLLWTSGLRSWKKLASRGFWVNGSTEGRGENIPETDALAPGTHFTKLSHLGAPSTPNMPLLPTYELLPTGEKPDFGGKEFFYWASGSSFDEAMKIDPTLVHKEHAAGPGNTFEHLRKKLPQGKKIHVFLSYKDWREF